jgi:hypothetical protein
MTSALFTLLSLPKRKYREWRTTRAAISRKSRFLLLAKPRPHSKIAHPGVRSNPELRRP